MDRLQSEIPSFGGRGRVVHKHAEPYHQVSLRHVPNVFREPIRDFHDLLRQKHRLLVTANVVPSSPIRDTLMRATLRSFESLVLTRATWRTSQKMAFFTVTAMKISNLTLCLCLQ
jgi:hypothetical protein